jgi:hypothetical protein
MLIEIPGAGRAARIRPASSTRFAARHGMRWYTRMGRPGLVPRSHDFLFRDRAVSNGQTLRQFWGEPQDAEEVPYRGAEPAARVLLARVERKLASETNRALPIRLE